MELCLDGIKVFKNVCVVKLEVVHYQRSWSVVQELGSSVEVGGVVFVCFYDKEGVRAEPGRLFEILRDTADQEARV